MTLLVVLGALASALFAVSMTGTKPHLFWGQTHHAYYGWVLIVAGAVLGSEPLAIVGNVLAWDDAYQHCVQAYGGSPVHVAYGWAYYLPWIRSANRFLDRLL